MSVTEQSNLGEYARYYIEVLGLALVKLKPGSKSPFEHSWQHNGITDVEQALNIWGNGTKYGMGVLLGPSGLVAVDVDHFEYALVALEAIGLDLEEELSGAPHIVGRPGRDKAIFRAPAGGVFRTRKLIWPSQLGPCPETGKARNICLLELRAGSVQDVLPPSIHPDTGEPYRWTPALDDFEPQGFPVLPTGLRGLWQNWGQHLGGLRAACPWSAPAPVVDRQPVAGSYSPDDHADWDALRAEIRRRITPGSILAKMGAVSLGHNKYLCPFHDEKHASFWLFDKPDSDTQRWCCAHGGAPVGRDTDKGHSVGDCIDLHAHHRGLAVGQATMELARELGLEPTRKKNREQASPVAPATELVVPAPTIRVITAADLMTTEVNPPAILLGDEDRPLITDADCAMLHAREGLGKSWLVLHLACLLASPGTDKEFLGIPVPDGATPVVLITAELGKYRLKQRLSEVLGTRLATEHFHLVSEEDSCGMDIAQNECIPALMKIVNERQAKLLILDPLAELWSGEELTRDLKGLLGQLRRLRVGAGCGVLLIHHEGKGDPSGASRRPDEDAFRGATALRAGMKSVMRLTSTRGVARLAHTKSNLGKKWPTTYLDLSEPCKLVKVPDPGSPSEAKEKNMRQVLKILQAADGAIGISKIMAHPNCPAVTEKSVLRYLKQLEQNGEVRRDGKGKATKYCFGTGDILSRSCPDSPQLLF